MPVRQSFSTRLKNFTAERSGNWQLFQLTRKIAAKARPRDGFLPVVFFNASTRITGMSLNAAFSYLAASGLQLAGVPVVQFGCQSGMSRCVLGTDRNDHMKAPPCRACLIQSERLYANAPTVWFEYRKNPALAEALESLSVDELSAIVWEAPGEIACQIPLGRLVLPSLRWAMRLHHLQDDEPTRFTFRQYLLSAYNIADKYFRFLQDVEPETAVIFNGIMYPEATARWISKQLGLRVVTHEVGFRPFSAFFTEGQATAYPMEIPEDFELTEEQNVRLDNYLEGRFQGEFTMAGIRFWKEMHGLDEAFEERVKDYRQIVPIFTNVVYDTSQVHANAVFPHMFAWLDLILEIIRDHPETFFILRAHPDEMRPGTAKQSRESVQEWVARNHVDQLPNVLFVNSQEYLSSYEIIDRAKFVMVYNSSIGLEAALLGAPVLCGGKARYTQYPMVFFPDSQGEYRARAEELLSAEGPIDVPPAFRRNARQFMYYQLYRASLPFEAFLENHPRPGYVKLKQFSWRELTTERSSTMRALVAGIVHSKPFINEEP